MNIERLIAIGTAIFSIALWLWNQVTAKANQAAAKAKREAFEDSQVKALQQSRIDLDKKIDMHIEDDLKIEADLKKHIQQQWQWKDAHVIESNEIRFEFQKQIGRIEALAAVRDSQYSQILSAMASMEKNLQSQIERIQRELSDLHIHGRTTD